MASNFLIILRNSSANQSKNLINTGHILLKPASRKLYAATTLGLENFSQQQTYTKGQMANVGEKFREKMTTYTAEEGDAAKYMVFTEDLKNMIHIAENNDADMDLVVKMMQKFNKQNKELRFGNYIFGPVVMRLFHKCDRADLALKCFKMDALNGFFDQLISYQILMDLLFENGKYNEVLEVFEMIKSRQIENTKYPRNIVVLTLASCYKLNSSESFKYATNLWNELMSCGHLPMRRAITFMASLAIKQKQPNIALEILQSARNQNYTTVRNLKILAMVEVGRIEDVLPILKGIFQQDTSVNVVQTVNREVLEKVKEALKTTETSSDVLLDFGKLETMLVKQGHVTDLTVEEQLCSEIQPPPMLNNRQDNRFSRFKPSYPGDSNNRKFQNFNLRPGLNDLV